MNIYINRCFIALSLLLCSVAMMAQKVVYKIELPKSIIDSVTMNEGSKVYMVIEDSTPVVPKPIDTRRGMIGRESTKNIFVPKGQWMVGGQVAWNQWNNDNLNYLAIKDINFEGYTFSAGPYFGYFFANNFAVGGRFSYHRYYVNLGELDLNLGDDLNIGLKDLYYLQHNYESSVFVRSYLPIGNSKVFGLFGEFQLNYTFSEGKNSTGSGETLTAVYERVNNLELGVAGGMAVFLANNVAAEVMVNVGGYRVRWGNQNTNNIEQGSITSSGANFRINLFSIKFGMTYYL